AVLTRRFTGSRETSSFKGTQYPVTNWMLDHPAPVDVTTWRLHIRGAVGREVTLTYTDLSPSDQERAVLDCTGGWYSAQDWQGVRVGPLLDLAAVQTNAVAVSFKSVTG